MYLLSIVMLIGAEINDVIARRAAVVEEPTSVTEVARDLRSRWRDN